MITRVADTDGVSAPVVERDYVLTHIVEELAVLPAPSGMVFKGGTALRLCFFTDFRYSADLDFSLVEMAAADASEVIRAALASAVARTELPRLELVDVPPLEIHYEGPLGGSRRIKLDLATDELVLNTQMTPMIVRYPDQTDPPPAVKTYTLDEIAAESCAA